MKAGLKPVVMPRKILIDSISPNAIEPDSILYFNESLLSLSRIFYPEL
jgi:hypothetical protein